MVDILMRFKHTLTKVQSYKRTLVTEKEYQNILTKVNKVVYQNYVLMEVVLMDTKIS